MPSEIDPWSYQVQRTQCVSRQKLQGLWFGSSEQQYDQRSLRSGDGMIRGHLKLVIIWSEDTSRWEWSDKRQTKAHISLIREGFEPKWVWSETILSGNFFFQFFVFFLPRDVGSAKRQQKAAFSSPTPLESNGFDQNQSGPADRKCRSP